MTSNLKPWPKGMSGNPGGVVRLPPEVRAERKKNQANLILLVTRLFAEPDTVNGDTQLEKAVQGMITKAREGDTPAFKYLIELVCGRIPETDSDSAAEQMTPAEKLEIMRRAVAALEAQVGRGPSQ
jgi:hypothetical protein